MPQVLFDLDLLGLRVALYYEYERLLGWDRAWDAAMRGSGKGI